MSERTTKREGWEEILNSAIFQLSEIEAVGDLLSRVGDSDVCHEAIGSLIAHLATDIQTPLFDLMQNFRPPERISAPLDAV